MHYKRLPAPCLLPSSTLAAIGIVLFRRHVMGVLLAVLSILLLRELVPLCQRGVTIEVILAPAGLSSWPASVFLGITKSYSEEFVSFTEC